MNLYRSSRWICSVQFLALGCASLHVTGCYGEDSKKSEELTNSAGSASSAGASPIAGSTAKTTSLGRGGASSTGGSVGKGGSGGIAGSKPTSSVAGSPNCSATASIDVPDAQGLDTNCDGIDGSMASSVFVSPYGLDSAAGTKDDPLRSIGKAVQIAQASGGKLTDVLVCTASYAENVVVASTAVGIHGGYDCTSWQRTAANSRIAPSAGIALRISGVKAMVLSKLDIQSADATGTSESSQAVQVVLSTGVHFEGSNITAGRGGPGTSAAPQAQTWNGTKPAKAASGEMVELGTDNSLGCHPTGSGIDTDFDGQKDTGSDSALLRCTTPKAGGDGPVSYCDKARQFAVKGGKGGSASLKPFNSTPIASTAGRSGQPANTAGAANVGTPGKSFGSVSEKGYAATNNGTDGADGSPGPSGFGGLGGGSCLVRSSNIETTDLLVSGTTETRAGSTCLPSIVWGAAPWVDVSNMGTGRTVTMFPGSGGGQGGYGGCGGFRGLGGTAGGASIALFVFESEVSLSRCNVTSSAGGNGGAASDGTEGQAGGEGGDGGLVLRSGVTLPFVNGQLLFAEYELKGIPGASGGKGQKGGSGGPGGGGPSVGILWAGSTKPVLESTVALKSSIGGFGGKPSPNGATPGADGLSSDMVDATAL